MQFNHSDPKSHLNPDEKRTQEATNGSLTVEIDELDDENRAFVAFVRNQDKDNEYVVKAVHDDIMCSCPDFHYRGADQGMACKHMLATFLKIENERQNGE